MSRDGLVVVHIKDGVIDNEQLNSLPRYVVR